MSKLLPSCAAATALAVLNLSLSLAVTGCKEKTPSGQSTSSQAENTPPPKPPPAEIWKEFSGGKAFVHTKAQCDIGPRTAGSPELDKARSLIIAELQKNGWTVEKQQFTDKTPKGDVQFTNLIGRYGNSDKTQQYIICSHYDTKIFDTIRFVGASDGASSTGALMELSRVLAMDPELAKKVELVFFDGEEAFVQFTPPDAAEADGLYGSRYYAKQLRTSGRNGQFKAGVLWDMIGDKDLTITLSPDSPPDLAREIFTASEQLQDRKYFSYFNRPILDDHLPLIQSHIATIDLIDFDYIYWHTADDTLDKLSPSSLQIVGAVTLKWLKNAESQPAQ